MVNAFAFCPRLAYLEWVQGEWEENEYTADGRFQHRVADREEGRFPQPPDPGQVNGAGEDASTLAPPTGTSMGGPLRGGAPGQKEAGETAAPTGESAFHARSVWLSAPREGLTARIDVIEGSGGKVMPVDYKRGEVPDTPERSWLPDRVQLCAQALVLRENGYACDAGVIYYVASKTRIEILFDDELVLATRRMADGLRETAQSQKMPPPLADSPKCAGCSLAGICLPDETHFLEQPAAAHTPPEDGLRRLVTPRDDTLPLYVQEQGAYLGKSGELFEVRKKGHKIGEAKIFETPQVSLFGNVQVSTAAIREMCARNIPACYFSTGGWFYGLVQGLGHKNVELRARQFRAAEDPGLCLRLARSFVSAKAANCRTLLKRNHPGLPEAVSSDLASYAERALAAPSLETLLGIEGVAARLYFQHFSGMLKTRGNKAAPDDLPQNPAVESGNVSVFDALTDAFKDLPSAPAVESGNASVLGLPVEAGGRAGHPAPASDALPGPDDLRPGVPPRGDQPSEETFDFNFEGRNRRPPLDPVNAMLSYAYSLLAKDCMITAMSVGFDPYLGFYHQPRYGRPALALDLMEEFRPIIGDSVVLWVINNGVLKPSDFIRRGPSCAMTPEARKKFIEAYEARMDALVTHPVFGYRISYRRVLQVQARLLGRLLLGEISEYPAFRTR
ncbi:MAG: CRISPR-associated endonuclease Cas1 [Planctomycetes bacterium]|nr:CRISPR-associated endonuclease Cas1 [Planctomycetota bacterium]